MQVPSYNQVTRRLSTVLNTYIHPDFRLKLAIIYGTLVILTIVRLYIGKPFLYLLTKHLSKSPGLFSFLKSNKNHPVRFIRILHYLFTNFFPLMFPFFVGSVVQIIRPSHDSADDYY